ncbi:MAG: phosphoglycerate dehydrogenase [Robiginitomaculum sp.]
MVRVLIADKMSESARDVFKNRGVDVDVMLGLSKEELIKIMPNYDGMAVRSACRPDADIIAAGTKLKVIGRAGIGTDNIDKKAATAQGVVVMNTPFGNAITTAEHAIALLLACARQIPAASNRTQNGEWPKADFKGVELYNKTLGLIGCGNIGALVAERALALKMKVVAYDPYLSSERAIDLGVRKVELDELLGAADAITLHTPLTEGTRGIINREVLAKTKPGLILVNAARGGLVDEAALKDGLETGHIRAAALDVFEKEPAIDNPLFGVKNFIATPHLGASTLEAQENVAVQVAEQMTDYLLSGAVTNALNMPSISAEEAPRLRPYVDLAEKLGAMTGQLLESPIKSVEFCYMGEVAKLNTKPMTAAALAGLLKPMMSEVNMVSAPAIASDCGLDVKESTCGDAEDHENLIKLIIKTEDRELDVTGSLYGGEPRLLNLFGVPMDAAFSPSMLYVRNLDKPGFIGALGGLLGENEVNIATFSLGRTKEGGSAICLVSVDEPVSKEIQNKVVNIKQVKFVCALNF